MKSTKIRDELRLMVIAIICALLLVLGHVVLAKAFSDLAWTEYTVAAIPFIMFGLCLGAIRYAEKQELS